MKPEDKTYVTLTGKKAKGIKPERVAYITEDVAYWRKANQIHNWFIANCASGEDNNTEMSVSREQLQELVDTCKKVIEGSELIEGQVENGYTFDEKNNKKPIMEDGKYIKDPKLAEELLPTTDGFFFGSTDYNEWYLDNLKETISQIEPLLAEDDDGEGEFIYSPSW